MFKVHFGKVTLKAFTKGEHVLRFEATVHNAATPCTGRVLLRFPALAARLRDVADRWLETFQYLDQAFVADETLDQLPTSAQLGRLSIGGFDLNKPHMRAMLGAAIACAQIPMGARLGDLVPRVPLRSGTLAATYGTRQAAYDLRSLRAKPFVRRASKSHRCQDPPDGLRTITALVVLREQVIEPILANVRTPHRALKPKTWTSLDDQYKTIRLAMQPHFADLGLVS